MKAVFLGIVLGLLVACPSLGEPVAAAVAQLAVQPLTLAFVAGVLLRPVIVRRVRRWAT